MRKRTVRHPPVHPPGAVLGQVRLVVAKGRLHRLEVFEDGANGVVPEALDVVERAKARFGRLFL